VISKPYTEDQQVFTKTLTNYINFGIDAIISNDFEPKRTKSRPLNNCIYAWLSVKSLFFRCCDPVNIKDIVESCIEYNSLGEEHVVFNSREMPTNPFSMIGVNIPSFYGGF